MEIVGSRRKSLLSSAGDAVPTIQLYRSAPELEVRLEDFELYAVHRLRGVCILLHYLFCVWICWIELVEIMFIVCRVRYVSIICWIHNWVWDTGTFEEFGCIRIEYCFFFLEQNWVFCYCEQTIVSHMVLIVLCSSQRNFRWTIPWEET